MKVGVVGLGYVGSQLALAATSGGHRVFGVDVDESRLLELRKSLALDVSKEFGVLSDCEVIVIAVPTPLNEIREPDLSFLQDAIQSLKPVVSQGTLIISESTSYPGTLREVIAQELGEGFLYASAPERVDPANREWNVKNTPRLVAGLNELATEKAAAFYSSFCDHVYVVSSPEVAEAAKLMENTFRQVNIALVNEFAQIAHTLGISAFEVLEAASTKPFGFMKFVPSVGVGGHCIPVDPSYLSFTARKNGKTAKFIDIANEVNLKMPQYVASRIADAMDGLAGKRIQIAGIAYKANVSDTRETPAALLIQELRDLGAEVIWHDPLVRVWNGESSSELQLVDAGVVVSPHAGMDFSAWENNGVRIFDVSTVQGLGWPKFI